MQLKKSIRKVCAEILGRAMRHFAFDPALFEVWQEKGYHVLPAVYSSPIPDTRDISDQVFSNPSQLIGIEIREQDQVDLLDRFSESYVEEFQKHREETTVGGFRFGNTSFESVDAEILYCMIRHFGPSRIVEVGSGFSTLVAVEAMGENAKMGIDTALTTIDPYPPKFLSELREHGVTLIETKVEDLPYSAFEALAPNDILFLDSSHVSRIGSDVNFEFLELLPRISDGVVVHVHDIFLPYDYPRGWVLEENRFWNEQYLLQAFLSGNRDFEVLWAGSWMHANHPDLLARTFASYRQDSTHPASFWFRKKSADQ